MDITNPRNRFYDREPGLAQAVELVLHLPEALQTIVANAIITVSNGLHDKASVGGHKVLGLYQAQQKRRAYDHNQKLLDMINHLMMVSTDNRPLVAVKSLKILGYLEKYLVLCHVHTQPADPKTVKGVLETYIDHGWEATEEYLGKLDRRFAKAKPVEE